MCSSDLQSFSHGRTKAVVVEKVKRRIIGPGETRPEAAAVEVAPAAVAPVARAPVAERPAPTAPSARQSPAASRSSGVVLRTLTEDERDARSLALVEARKREEIDRKQAEIEAKLRAERMSAEQAEREAAEARRREEEQRRRAEYDIKEKAEATAMRRTIEPDQPSRIAPSPTPPLSGRRLLAAKLEHDDDDRRGVRQIGRAHV